MIGITWVVENEECADILVISSQEEKFSLNSFSRILVKLDLGRINKES
jgi:hypothetical protein